MDLPRKISIFPLDDDPGLEYHIGPKYGRPGDERRLSELLLKFGSTAEESIKWVHKDDILYLEPDDALKVIVTTVLGVMGEWALPSLCSKLRRKAYAEPRPPATVVSELVKLTGEKRREELSRLSHCVTELENWKITGYVMSLALEEAPDIYGNSASSLVLLRTNRDGTLVTDNFSQTDTLQTPGMIINAAHTAHPPTMDILVGYKDKFEWVKINPPSFLRLNAMGIYFVYQLRVSNKQDVNVGEIAEVVEDKKCQVIELWTKYIMGEAALLRPQRGG